MFIVQHSINIEIDEKGLKQLIIDEVARQNPAIAVDDIKFTQRRNPTEIEVAVTGHVEDGATHASVSGTNTTGATAVVEEVTGEQVVEEEGVLDPASQLLAEEADESLDDILTDEEPEEEEEDPFGD
jgi:ACT domain-containing protein